MELVDEKEREREGLAKKTEKKANCWHKLLMLEIYK